MFLEDDDDDLFLYEEDDFLDDKEAIVAFGNGRLGLWLADFVRVLITGLFDRLLLFLAVGGNHDVIRAKGNLVTPVVEANIRTLEESGSEADMFGPDAVGSEQGAAGGAILLKIVLHLDDNCLVIEVKCELPEIVIVLAV